jgi:D-arabinose 5-phosphate isomerase GutQ
MGSLPAPASAECAPRPQGRATVAASDLAPLFSAQRRHLDHFFDRLDMAQAAAFAQALLDAPGAVFFTGVGKSGIVARKTAQTLASLGLARAGFLAPVDALHGDIGALFPGDVLVILSKSGASDELLALAPCARAKGAYLVSLTSAASGDDCPLAAACDLNVHLPLQGEVCPFGLAPVTSTAIQMVFGDTVIAAIMEARRLSRDQYASNHPAGKIGKTLIFKVIKSTTSNPNINRLPALLQLLFLETFNYLVPTHSVGHRIGSQREPDALSLLGFLHRCMSVAGGSVQNWLWLNAQYDSIVLLLSNRHFVSICDYVSWSFSYGGDLITCRFRSLFIATRRIQQATKAKKKNTTKCLIICVHFLFNRGHCLQMP